jgi:hypothetical protein
VAQLSSLGGITRINQHITMNTNKRPLAIIALGLLLAAILVPFIIVVFGHRDFAVGFSVVAGLLAMILGAFSRSARFGKAVTVGLLLFLVVGMTATFIVSTIRVRHIRAEYQARMQAEHRQIVAEIESHRQAADLQR